MEKTRSIIELFEIALNNFDDKFDNMGLCSYVAKLEGTHIISADEYNILITYIYKHKPRTKYINRTTWFWEPYKKAPRKAYLQRMLNTMYKQSHGIYNKEKKII